MKKIAIVLMTILCMVMAVSLTACNGGGQLATPVVVINGNSLSWEPVENASGYVVKVDGKVIMTEVDGKEQEQIITDTMYTYVTDVKGAHTISVKAKGTGNYTDSEFSAEITFFPTQEQLKSPTLTSKRDGNKITYKWNAVPNAASYTIKIGLNLNETKAIAVPAENGTTYEIDVTEKAYSEIGEYKAKVFAISNDENYSDSKGSNSVTYVNTYQIKKPTDFKCDKDIFKWTKADEQGNKYRVTAVSDDGKKTFENETTGTSLSFANLRITEPGVYKVSVVAFSTGDRTVYLDSEKSDEITITILEGVDPIHFKLSGSVLSWNAITNASGYTITATTKNGVSFPISIENGATTSYDLSENKDFRTLDRAGKMFSFEIVAEGNTTDANKLVFDSTVVPMDKGSYYQYLPNVADYADEASKKDIIPAKVNPENGEPYYAIKTFPELMWALSNADATIRLENNISVSSTEFVSPITSFSGRFDGNGHSITNIKMTDNFNRSSLSIFGDLSSDAVIEDLVISGITMQVADRGLKNGIIANKNNGTIQNVVVMSADGGKAKMTALNDTDLALIAYENNGVISDVVVGAELQAMNAAGIAIINNVDKTISNATVYGKITGVAVDKDVLVGSIVANNKGNIAYSMGHASVLVNTVSKAKTTAMGVVGGIVAINDGNIEYTYFTRGVEANCAEVAYAGGFVGINNGTISKSYVESSSNVARKDAVTYLGGFAGKNAGTISNAYASISFALGYYETKGGFVADNSTGTISNVAFNQGKAGTSNIVLEQYKGTVTDAKGYENNKLTLAVTEVLGDEFVVYNDFKTTVPVLKNVIYVQPDITIITGLEQNIDLLKYKAVDFKKYYFGGEAKTIPSEIDGNANVIRTNSFTGYQLVKYTANAGTAEAPVNVVFNRLIQVK